MSMCNCDFLQELAEMSQRQQAENIVTIIFLGAILGAVVFRHLRK